MKLLVTTVLLAVAWASPPQPRGTEHPTKTTKQAQEQTNDNKQGSNSPTAEPELPTRPHASNPEGTQITDTNKEQPVRITTPVAITAKPDYATWGFSLALVVVGAFQVWLLFGTMRATADNASAAKLSAEALIRSERARLLVDNIHDPYLVPIEGTPIHDQRLSHCFLFVKNFGKGPATVVAVRFELQISDRLTAPPYLQLYDLKPNSPTVTPFVVPQGESWPAEAQLMPSGRFITPSELAEVPGKPSLFWLCGMIRYYDVFERKDDEHETCLCYLWETRLNTPKPIWRRAGPATFNKST